MSDVTVYVRGRPYRLGCPAGQEDRIRGLARLLDEHGDRLEEAGAPFDRVSEATGLVMIALSLADTLDTGDATAPTLDPAMAAHFAELLSSAARRVEDLAEQLESK